MSTIGSLMRTEIVIAEPTESVAVVAERMRDNAVGAVLVVDAGRLVGMFSERDLLTRVVAAGRNAAETLVGEVATRDVVAVSPDTRIRRCAEILKEKRFRHLPVADGGRPVGILSARDFFEYVVDGLEHLIDQARYEALLEEGVDPYDHLGGGYEA